MNVSDWMAELKKRLDKVDPYCPEYNAELLKQAKKKTKTVKELHNVYRLHDKVQTLIASNLGYDEAMTMLKVLERSDKLGLVYFEKTGVVVDEEALVG